MRRARALRPGAPCSGRGQHQQGGRGWAAGGYTRHDLDRRMIDSTHLDRGGQPRSANGAPDQIDLVLIGVAQEEYLERDIDRCWLVDRQHDLGVVRDGLEAQA